MSEETIIKLLKSSIEDDQILGVTLAAEILGEAWCRDNFNKTKFLDSSSKIVLEYDGFCVFIGPRYIEYTTRAGLRALGWLPHDVIIINNKTNDTNKELSENTCEA